MFQTQHSEPFTVIGLPLRTSNAQAFETIPAHWQRFYRDELLARIPARLSDEVIALYTQFEHAGRDNEGEYTFVIGAPVAPDAEPPEGLIQVDVPAVRCAVFEVDRGLREQVGATWRTIWQQQGLPRRYVCDHERYRADGRIHRSPRGRMPLRCAPFRSNRRTVSRMTPITLRRAALTDLDTLAALFDAYRQFYEQAPDRAAARAFIAARLQRSESVILLAEDAQGTGLGFCQLYPTFCSISAAPVYILSDLFVAPATRRAGTGRNLLLAAERQARADGMVRLDLTTARTNLVAQSLYESLGWTRDQVYIAYNRPIPA